MSCWLLSTFNLLDSFPSVYIKHHATETSIHDQSYESSTSHLSQTSWLSTAFDTIVYSFLLEFRSSWFGISSTAFCWIKSYLLNWMSSNLLSLNPSKTVFLIFGLPQQLSELNNPTMHPNNFKLSPVSKLCFYNIHDPRCFRNNIDKTTAGTLGVGGTRSKFHILSFEPSYELIQAPVSSWKRVFTTCERLPDRNNMGTTNAFPKIQPLPDHRKPKVDKTSRSPTNVNVNVLYIITATQRCFWVYG